MTEVRGSPGHLARLRVVGSRLLLGEAFRGAEATCAASQWLPGDALWAQQWAQVGEVLAAAQTGGPFYRDRLDGVDPGDVTLQRFRQIPPLTRAEVASRALQSARASRWPMPARTSGGTDGSRVAIPVDRATYAWYVAGTWRGFSWWGVHRSDCIVLALGRSRASPLFALLARVKDRMMGWHRVPVDDDFDRRASQVLERLCSLAPAALYGYPSAVDRLAAFALSSGRALRTAPRVIVLTGEPLYAFQRARIEAAFGCPVAEEYGMGELGCIAFQCPQGTLHVCAESVLVEVVPATTDCSLSAGRILATHLRNRAFPLIRYDTGDMGGMPAEVCTCGRGLPQLRVLGRVSDHLTGPGGAMAARLQLERLFSALPERLQGRVRVRHPAPGTIRLEMERSKGVPGADVRLTASTAADVFGRDWTVHVAEVERFQRLPSGKLAYFVCA